MNLRIPGRISEAGVELAGNMAKKFDSQFSGLADGMHHVDDETFRRWFEAELKKRPNMVQMMALVGADGTDELHRYARITGRENVMNAAIALFRGMAKGAL